MFFSPPGLVIKGLKERFDEATRRNDVKAIVLTGKVSMDRTYSVTL